MKKNNTKQIDGFDFLDLDDDLQLQENLSEQRESQKILEESELKNKQNKQDKLLETSEIKDSSYIATMSEDNIEDINSQDEVDIFDLEIPNAEDFSNDDGDDIENIVPPSKRRRNKVRKATARMENSEYRAELNRLNKDAENKNYILFFGLPNSGKSYIIASLLHYMSSFSNGRIELNIDKTTISETDIYNQMIEMFSNPEKNVRRTDVNGYYEISIKFIPSNSALKPTEFTFVDASGEHIEQAYAGDNLGEKGNLPDYLEVILESEVNCKFAFVYDHSIIDEENQRVSQVMVLRTLYEKVCRIQEKHKKYFPKILLISKSDKIPESIKEKYHHSPVEYVLDSKSHMRDFANGFFKEQNNRTIFYSMGEFNRIDDIVKFDTQCPEKLFDWFYRTANGGTTTIESEKFCEKIKRWFFGN